MKIKMALKRIEQLLFIVRWVLMVSSERLIELWMLDGITLNKNWQKHIDGMSKRALRFRIRGSFAIVFGCILPFLMAAHDLTRLESEYWIFNLCQCETYNQKKKKKERKSLLKELNAKDSIRRLSLKPRIVRTKLNY